MTGAGVRLYLGTEDGLYAGRLGPDGFRRRGSSLDGEAVRSLAVHPREPDTV